MDDKPVALIVLKFNLATENGSTALGALQNLSDDGTLYTALGAILREDGAPMGNLARTLQEVLRKA